MYNMSGSASAKFRRDRLEASQPNHRKLSESNAVACARPQAPALLNNINNNNINKYEEASLGQGQGQINSVNKTDNDLRALGAMPPVTILKLHEQRLNLNSVLLAQLTKQVEDFQKKPVTPLNNNNNNNNTSNELALTSRIADLEQKMSRLSQPSTVSTPVVVVPEISKQQFDALSLKCTNMEGQLYTLMTTMHSLNDTRISNQINQINQTDEQVKKDKQDKQDKRKDLLHSLIDTQRGLVSDISVLVKTLSNSQKPCSCAQVISTPKQPDCICSLNTLPITSSLSNVLPLLGVDVVSILPEVVTLTEVNVNINDTINAEELLPNESDLSGIISDVICDVNVICDVINVTCDVNSDVNVINDVSNDVISDTIEPVIKKELDTINEVSLSPLSTDIVELQKTPTQPIKSGRKSKRTVVSI